MIELSANSASTSQRPLRYKIFPAIFQQLMSMHSQSAEEVSLPSSNDSSLPKPKRRMSTTQRLLFFGTAWLICLMPFLFWWSTWFGRPLSDHQLNDYLHDSKHPRHVQHALVQLGDRMAKQNRTQQDAATKQWYPELVRLAADPIEEVRNTDAWVMGQDTSGDGFHETLLKMLTDPSPMVRGNAALSLVRFGDPTGRPQILALLQPAHITAPTAGRIVDTDKAGTAIHQGGLIAKLAVDQSGSQPKQTVDIRSPIPGRIRSVGSTGVTVATGAEVAVVDPATEQVWEALRALYLVGQTEDLPAIRPYERELLDIPDHVRQQAVETEKAIRAREK
jgi:HEAT repeat